MEKMNRLSKEKAAYLKHSAYQKIDWYPWSEEAFERAKREDKPVFLSSGAIWCHWCHVMAKECFEDEEVVRLLNEHCINIKLDRDERPEIDRIYQQAVAAMGSGGGWPLSVFLTPDKKPFFGGTYFPPEDSYGRPGFKKVVRMVGDFYREKKEEISGYVEKLMGFLKPEPTVPGSIKKTMVSDAAAAVLSEFDPQNGGFGKAPKFPMAGAMEFLVNQCFMGRKESIVFTVEKTLEAMAKGGFHDQLGGGFHRYSVDEAWIVPHFEKMADDNAWLLRNYVDAYHLFGDEYFRRVAEGIITFTREVLSDPEGGFYASQDADVTPDDEGGYFTWTDGEFRNVLNDEEYKILSLHLLHERGSMHHDRAKKVLFVATEAQEIAEKFGREVETVAEIIGRGKKKLLGEREKRETPFVDTTFYTSLNGMLVSAYLKAYRALGDSSVKDFALKTLERITKLHSVNNGLLHTEGVTALLDDYVHLIDAFIAAYEVTGNSAYRDRASGYMNQCIEKFWDSEDGGFFDTEEEVVGVRLKRIEDIPHPSANSVAIIALLKLFFIADKEIYFHYAETALKAFSSGAKGMGIHSGYYYCAVDAFYHMIKLNLETSPSGDLAAIARVIFHPYISMAYGEDKGCVTPCKRGSCFDPICTPEGLRDFLKKYR